MYCIGLTGNIGSGKSTAIACFQSLNIAVISADTIARQLCFIGEPAYLLIRKHFSKDAFNPDGEINRPFLKQLIFTDSTMRITLENILHPLIKEEIKKQIAISTGLYCVIEIPLLSSREEYPYLDRILVIMLDRELEIARVMKRDHCERKQALAIIHTQPGEQLYRQIADDILFNNGSIQQFNNKIKKLHEKYLQMAVKKSL